MAEIRSVAGLREIVPLPNPALEKKLLGHLDEQARNFIQASPFLLMATTDSEGMPDVSPKGDEPGFVQIEDERTLLFPERDGNNMALGLRNILANPRLSLIFMLPATGETLRVNGEATLLDDPEILERLSARGKPARLALRIVVQRAYFHCARSILRAGLWKPETWPEKRKISFGRIIAPRMGQGEAAEKQIDDFVEEGYRTGL